MESPDIRALNDRINDQSAFIDLLQNEISKAIVGQHYMTERLMLGMLSQGHILLEGVPGLAKTLAIKSLAQAIDGKFNRIQFTPDLLPADVIGTLIYNQGNGKFEVKKGPIFANFILADEINRAPAKVQSALLQAMQERQVTISDTTYNLEEPFLVMATQNPIEQEGTYPLPEAQVDRFMLKVVITYPTMAEEQQILRMQVSGHEPVIKPVIHPKDVLKARGLVREVYLDEKIEQYILNLVFATRQPDQYQLSELKPLISYGASPRATISMAIAAKAHAFMKRRGFVIPDDVRAVCMDVLRHRVGITYEAEAENVVSEQIIEKIMARVEVP